LRQRVGWVCCSSLDPIQNVDKAETPASVGVSVSAPSSTIADSREDGEPCLGERLFFAHHRYTDGDCRSIPEPRAFAQIANFAN
jgi:hypothetical protein